MIPGLAPALPAGLLVVGFACRDLRAQADSAGKGQFAAARRPAWVALAAIGLLFMGPIGCQRERSPRAPTSVAPSTSSSGRYVVQEVVDGDMIHLWRIANEPPLVKVRLLGVEAPELMKHEPYSEESSAILKELVDKRPVWIEPESDAEGREVRDRNGRLLAWVYLDKVETRPLGVDLVEKGACKVGPRGLKNQIPAGDSRLKWLRELVRAQLEACRERRGLWGLSENDDGSPLAVVFIKFWGDSEAVYLVNRGTAPLDLSAWEIHDSRGQSIKLERCTREGGARGGLLLSPGKVCAVRSGQPRARADDDPALLECEVLLNAMGARRVWDNDGDEAHLFEGETKRFTYVYAGTEG